MPYEHLPKEDRTDCLSCTNDTVMIEKDDVGGFIPSAECYICKSKFTVDVEYDEDHVDPETGKPYAYWILEEE